MVVCGPECVTRKSTKIKGMCGSCLGFSQTEKVSLESRGIQNELGALLLVVNALEGLGVKDFVATWWGKGIKVSNGGSNGVNKNNLLLLLLHSGAETRKGLMPLGKCSSKGVTMVHVKVQWNIWRRNSDPKLSTRGSLFTLVWPIR